MKILDFVVVMYYIFDGHGLLSVGGAYVYEAEIGTWLMEGRNAS